MYNSQDGKSSPSRQRPGMVTALAVLVALDAVAEGCGGLANAVKSSNSLVGGVTVLFMSVLIVVMLALAWGLWQMKNWARIGVIIVIIIGFLLSIPQFITDTSDNPGLLIIVIPLALLFRGAIIYWLAVNGKYFNNAATQGVSTGNETPPAVGDAGSGMVMAIANAGGSGGISRKTLIGLAVGIGLIAIIACVAVGYFVYVSTQPIATQTMAFGSSAADQGALNEPDVIGVDGSGNIVVGDLKDGRVRTFDPSGKVISSFNVPKGTAGFTYIMGMAVSHDGTIYIAGDVDNAILIFNESGKLLGQIAINQDDYLNVAISPNGTLYALTDTDLVRFNKDGSVALRVQIYETISTVSSDLAVDGLGNIYVADNYGEVFKLSPTGDLISKFSRETNDSYPEKIAVDEYGRIFVTDLSEKSIQVFDSNGNRLGNISGIYDGIAFDQQNNLYANEEASNVVKFQVRPGGTLIANNASGNSNDPVVPTPTPSFASNTLTFSGTVLLPVQAISVTSNRNIVLGYSDGQLQTFDSSGKLISTISIALPNTADGPASLAFGKDGTIYAQQAGIIFVYDNTGKLLQKIGDNQHYYRNIAMGSDGTLYATTDQDTIVHFDSKGKISLEISKTFEKADGRPESHAQIAVDAQGNIYVAGPLSGVVLNFTPQGHYVSSFAIERSAGFAQLEGIAIDGYGRIYISDSSGDVLVYDSSGSYVNSIQGVGTEIAIDNQNNLYAVDSNYQVSAFQIQKPSGQ